MASGKYQRVETHDDDDNDDGGGGDDGTKQYEAASSDGAAALDDAVTARRQRTASAATGRPSRANTAAAVAAPTAPAASVPPPLPQRLDISLAPVRGRPAAPSPVATFSYAEPAYSEDDVRLELGGGHRVSNIRKFRSDVAVWIDSLHLHIAVMALLVLDLLLVLLDVALGNGSLVAYVLTLPVMIALCMETGLRAFALGTVFLSPPYLAAAELGISWLSTALFFALPQVGRLVLLARILLHVPTLRTAWLHLGELMTERQRDAAAAQAHLLENTDDLDLAPITPHVIVMPYPGLDRFGRRILTIPEVGAFLDRAYLDGYRLFNVAADANYSADAFHGRVERFPVADGDTATLARLIDAARALERWLRDNPKGVAIVHCDTGMGRACQMVAAYLLITRLSATAQDALSLVANRRTTRLPGQREPPFNGTDVPSQERFLQYLEGTLPQFGTDAPLPTAAKRLARIEVRGLHVPPDVADRAALLSVDVYSEGNKVYSSSDFHHQWQWAEADGALVLATEQLAKYPVQNDVKVVFRSAVIRATVAAPHDALFHAWVHMAFAPPSGRWTLARTDLDYAHMPANAGAVGAGLEVTLHVADV